MKLLFATLWMVCGLASRAVADTSVTCTALEIRASVAASPNMPPELKALEKKLRKPPFSSWNAFALLSNTSVVAVVLKPTQLALVMGKAALLVREASAQRVAVTVTMDDESGQRVVDTKVSMALGDYVVIGRPIGNDGHLLAIRCVK